MLSKVLIVDDEAELGAVLAEFLHEEGFPVETAQNGLEAARILEQAAGYVVLLDAMMPVLDGYGLIEHLAQRQCLQRHTVLLYSAAGRTARVQALIERGQIAAFLQKPFDLDKLLAYIQRVAAINQAEPLPPPAPSRLRLLPREERGA